MKKGARRMKQKQNWMKQSAGLKVAGWVAWLVLGAVVLAFAEEPVVPVTAAEAAPVALELSLRLSLPHTLRSIGPLLATCPCQSAGRL